MSMSSSLQLTPALKLMPSSLLKNLRAIAALVVLDHLHSHNSMKLEDQHRFCYDSFHGNTERNFVSQIQLLFDGANFYRKLYDYTNMENETIDDAETCDVNETQQVLLKQRYGKDGKESHYSPRYIRGEHFTVELLSSPTKSKVNEKATGRYIYDLAMSTLRNLKKAKALAEQYLDGNGHLPSGKCWDDLYSFLHDKSSEISTEKDLYHGWVAFEILTEFNSERKNHLCLLTTDGGDPAMAVSRVDFRRKVKEEKKEQRIIAVENKPTSAPFQRNMNVESRLREFEMAQGEDGRGQRVVDNILTQMNVSWHNLLLEREQAIELAKITCPEYDENNIFWGQVIDLSKEINNLKATRNELVERRYNSNRADDYYKSTRLAERLRVDLTEEESLQKKKRRIFIGGAGDMAKEISKEESVNVATNAGDIEDNNDSDKQISAESTLVIEIVVRKKPNDVNSP